MRIALDMDREVGKVNDNILNTVSLNQTITRFYLPLNAVFQSHRQYQLFSTRSGSSKASSNATRSGMM
jgi:hypothetical protein